MAVLFKKMSPARILALGFISVILIGSLLLMLPFCHREGVTLSYLDSLYTATSAVCVTGLMVVDAGDTFSLPGQVILLVLIQIGGLGVASMGCGLIMAMGGRVNLKGRTLIKEALNLDSGKGLIPFLKTIFFLTVCFELGGTLLCFPVFVRDYAPLQALWISLFHAVAAFNNSGLDVLGHFQSLSAYQDNLWLNLVTCLLIILGGIGFLVIEEVWNQHFKWRRLSLHSKVVLSVSLVLILAGTLLLKLTEGVSWLTAFFQSVTARTAGFSTISMDSLSNAGLMVMLLLMLVGASPGSTAGGIKTTTFYVLLQGIKTAAINRAGRAFHYSLPPQTFRKASVIFTIAIGAIGTASFLLAFLQPELALRDILFEMTSAFATVGLSTGITTSLHAGGKLLSIVMMFIGRLGPLTIASLWYFDKGERISYPYGNLSIG